MHLKEPEAPASTESIVTSTSSDVTLSQSATPPLWHPISEVQCREFYNETYCRVGMKTFDGLSVRFAPRQFDHAFFHSTGKTEFCIPRAERVCWIGPLLADPRATLAYGYIKKKKRYTRERRVAIWPERRYVVIIIIERRDPQCAHFLTGFYVDGPKWKPTLDKLVASPHWTA